MAETILPNVRLNSDWRAAVRLTDGGVAVDWTTLSALNVIMVAEEQSYAFAGGCRTTIDEDDATKLHIVWPAQAQVCEGIHRLVVQIRLDGAVHTYDKRVVNVVPFTSTAASVKVESDVNIEVSEVDTSVLTEILRACQEATIEANAAAAEAKAAIADVEEATNKANAAAEKADAAADVANTAADRVDASIAKAEEAAKEATEATEVVKATDEAVKAAESARKSSETAREEAEAIRKSNEEGRVSAESKRTSAESLRIDAEELRASAEVGRISAEDGRVSAEKERAAAEETRIASEKVRESNEASRKSAEDARITSETARNEAETTRSNNESARKTSEQERQSNEEKRKTAETSRADAETKRVAAETKRESDTASAISKAETATSNANAATTAAQTATTEAQQATTDANAAAKAATEAKEAIEQDTAVVKTSAQELTDEQATQARENIGAGKQTDVERIQETLGHYTQRADIVLTAKETGVAISSDGVKVSKSGWAIAEFVAEKGVEYLFKPGVTDGSVCIFAQMITSKETRSIDYTYTYNDDGNVATATATYNGATHTYTFSYDEETGVQTITDESGTIVSALPYQYETSVGSYLPMTRLNAGAELPEDGYCRLMSHFQGNASLKVVVSYKVGSADLTMRVVKDGVFASVATQLGNLSGNISSTQSALASVEQGVASLDTFVEDNPSIGQYDFPELPLLCGQPPILQGYGTPQESVVPINWKQYDPDTDEGYDWTGRPSALNQQYINLSATTGGNYIAVWEDEATRELKWKAL